MTGPTFPEVRNFFIPDPGCIIADCDLDRADLQVVVWEAQDDDLKEKLREGVDLHKANASDLFGVPFSHVNPKQRQFAKTFVHGTNYGGSARTMARNAGCTIREAESAQSRWFGAHPGIKRWHDRVANSLSSSRAVHNAFGFRRYYFDRIEAILPEALAWIPQSTVALVTNQGWKNIDNPMDFPEVEVLLQVHDSLVFQYPITSDESILLPKIRKNLEVVVPYPDPLTIPVGLKTSTRSWGECKEKPWPST